MNKALVALLMSVGIASAATIKNDFDAPWVSFSDGGVTTFVTALGVTFHFSGAEDANYGFPSTIAPLPLTDPVLDGPVDGILTLDFLQPVTSLSFDFVVGIVSEEVPDAVTVTLFGSGSLPGPLVAGGGAPPDGMLSQGAFTYSGSPFTQAVITFSSGAQRFLIDNLAYDQVEFDRGLNSPEPSTITLAGIAMLLAAVRLKRVRR